MRRLFYTVLTGALVVLLPSSTTIAAEPSAKAKGLQITPVRQEVKVDAGSRAQASLVVANVTDQSLHTSLQLKSFSVSNYTYEYTFANTHDNWLALGQTEVTLDPEQSKTIPFEIHPPENAAPGGYYYSIITSTKFGDNRSPSTIQAASLVYITVNGDLVQTGQIKGISAPKVVFARQFNVSIDTVNTGNVHYFASITGRVRGLLAGEASIAPNHLLMPHAVRRVSNTIRSPVLPGVYPVDVEYTTDTGTMVGASQWVVFFPFWSIAVLLGATLIFLNLHNKKRKNNNGQSPDSPRS